MIHKGHSPFCPFNLYPRGSRNLAQSILSVWVRGKGVLSAALLGEKQAAKKRRRRRDERMRGEGEKTQLIPFGLSARARGTGGRSARCRWRWRVPYPSATDLVTDVRQDNLWRYFDVTRNLLTLSNQH